jgi:8-oxo-dGTP diphosphatase
MMSDAVHTPRVPLQEYTAEPAAAPPVPRVVVAAVIERDGLILAARRTEPPALAGRWEFPGGKVEPGESDEQALVRECEEELGVRVEVGPRVGPQYPIADGAFVVRTYRAALAGGEPAPIEGHDQLRWVRPGPEADALTWLDGDYLVLAELGAEPAAHSTRVA